MKDKFLYKYLDYNKGGDMKREDIITMFQNEDELLENYVERF